MKITKCKNCEKVFEQVNWGKKIYCNSFCSNKHPNIIKFNNSRKNKTYEEIYGEDKAKVINLKKSISLKETILNYPAEKKLEISKIRSEIAKRIGSGGYKLRSGRGKNGWYKGYWCDSSYELVYVIYNLEHGIKFERNKKSFKYLFKSKEYNYYPDFILDDGTYVEIKGYKSEQWDYKKLSVPNIKVLFKEDLKKEFEYVINKYGKNFINYLYSSKG